jgi:hypothetical protein
MDSFEDVFLIIDFSTVDHVEDLEIHEDVENVGHVMTGTIDIVLQRIESSVVPISQTTWIEVSVQVGSFKSPLGFRLGEKVFTSENDSVDDDNLVDRHAEDVLDHCP